MSIDGLAGETTCRRSVLLCDTVRNDGRQVLIRSSLVFRTDAFIAVVRYHALAVTDRRIPSGDLGLKVGSL